MEEGDESFDVHNLGKDPENEEEERFEVRLLAQAIHIQLNISF